MSRQAFTRPSNKTFISFKERLLYGVISPPKFKVCFRCSSSSFNHATFEFNNLTFERMLYAERCMKSNEDMILALAGQFKQLSHEPEKFR